MHTLASRCLVVVALSAVGCGGAKTSPAVAPAEPAPSASESAAPVASAGEGTTTAPMPYDGGAGQGTKLPLLASGLDAGADASSDGGPRRAHEPGRGPDDIRTAVVARRAETRACIEKGSAGSTGGRSLTMQWTIDPKGNVVAPAVDPSKSDVTDPAVVKCIADILKQMKFGSSPGGYETKASYPFIFHRQHNVDGGSP